MANAASPYGQREERPFDLALSLRLDALILKLDAQPAWMRRKILRLNKRWFERTVPAFYSSGRAGR